MKNRLDNLKAALDTVTNQVTKTANDIQARATKMIAYNAGLPDPDDEFENAGTEINAAAAELLAALPHVHAAAASASAAAPKQDDASAKNDAKDTPVKAGS